MKREGRQNGIVGTRMILQPPGNLWPRRKVVNEFNSPPTAGSYNKVSSKPKREKHTHPACKSRKKAKGKNRLKSFDVATNHRLITWRVVDSGVGFNYTGRSANVILSHLSEKYWNEDDDEVEYDEEGNVEDADAFVDGPAIDYSDAKVTDVIRPGVVGIEEEGDDMGFHVVGFVWDCIDDDGDWCLVGEM